MSEGKSSEVESASTPDVKMSNRQRLKIVPQLGRKIHQSDHQQKVSSATLKQSTLPSKRKRTLSKNTMTVFDMIYFNPLTNPIKNKENASKSKDVKPIVKEEKPPVSLESTPTVSVPQLKLNATGDMILDSSSLTIETTATKFAKTVFDTAPTDENNQGNGFYNKKMRTREWLPSETLKFYECLHTIGTDFSLMTVLFPKRNRRDLLLKFKKEERLNYQLISKALLHPKKFDVDTLQSELLAKQEAEEKELEKKVKLVTPTPNKRSKGGRAITCGARRQKSVGSKRKKASGRRDSKSPKNFNLSHDSNYEIALIEVDSDAAQDESKSDVYLVSPTAGILNTIPLRLSVEVMAKLKSLS